MLLDCGLFQGLKELRLRNWAESPFDPRSLDAVVLSHAHLDHSGYLPLLVKRGFRGPIYCTAGTADLLRVLLPDSAHLMEEEANYANRHGYSSTIRLCRSTPAKTSAGLSAAPATALRTLVRGRPRVRTTLRRAGHILGSASVELLWTASGRRLVFSGDLGRWGDPSCAIPISSPRPMYCSSNRPTAIGFMPQCTRPPGPRHQRDGTPRRRGSDPSLRRRPGPRTHLDHPSA